jgi:hypothetical protein
MKRKTVLSIFLFLCLIQISLLNGQFTSSELEKRGEQEKFLQTVKIVRSERIGEGVTKPYRLYLQEDEIEISGCWKNPKGMRDGFLEGWQYEIAAYEMDKLLNLNMVPPTVERIFKGKKGSLQFWVDSPLSDLERMEKGMNIPAEHLVNWSKRKYLTRAFDCLIGNEDRTQQNIRYTGDWRTILIDHSRSFRSSKKFTKQLMYGKNGIKSPKLIKTLPRTFIEKLKSLTFDNIKEAVGPYLKDKEIKSVLSRRDLLLIEIEEMIKEIGEDKFLY